MDRGVEEAVEGDPRPGQEAPSQSERRFRALAEATTEVLYCVSPDWTELRHLDGRGFLIGSDKPNRSWMSDYIPEEDQPLLLERIEQAISSKSRFEFEHRVRRADGTIGWTFSRALPVFDDNGEIAEWVGAASDITSQRDALDKLAKATLAAEQQKRFYESLIASTPDLVYAFDRDYRFTFANRALLAMWGRSLEDSVGKRLQEVGYEPWHAEMHEREIDRVIADKTAIRGEVGFPHASLGWRTYDYIFTPVLDDEGEVAIIAGTTRDISDLKRSEEHLRLLVNELNHRVKNTLATVQSIAAQTFRGDAAKEAFESRLIALSTVHTVLTSRNWEGANLAEVAMNALAPFQSADPTSERTRIVGDDVELDPQTSLALAMAFHELASNAAKYGALSTESGRVCLHWRTEGGRLKLHWEEQDGPAVGAPSHRGFGSRLIEKGLGRELKGDVVLKFEPAGVRCAIDLPLVSGAPN